MLKWISILAVCAAVITASLSAVYVMNAREAEARHKKDAAESAEESARQLARKAENEMKTAQANENAERARQAAAEQQRIAAEADREAKRAEEVRAKHDSAAAADNRKAREAEAAAAADMRTAERSKADAIAAEAAKARALADAEASKAQAEADRRAREAVAAQAVADEARLWELKALDLATLEKDLNDFKDELDKREFALRPEKTIKDLAGYANTTNAADSAEAARIAALPENDPDLPKADRILARRQRLVDESMAAFAAKSRSLAEARLEKLYVAAVRAGRVTDAEYYKRTLKSLYPDWTYKPQTEEQPAPEAQAVEQPAAEAQAEEQPASEAHAPQSEEAESAAEPEAAEPAAAPGEQSAAALIEVPLDE